MAQDFTKKARGFSSSGSGSLPSTGTEIVDEIPIAAVNHIDYIINFRNSDNSQTQSLKLSARRVDGGIKDIVYSKMNRNNVADTLSIDVVAQVSGLNFELEITNNESFSVDYSFIRFIL